MKKGIVLLGTFGEGKQVRSKLLGKTEAPKIGLSAFSSHHSPMKPLKLCP